MIPGSDTRIVGFLFDRIGGGLADYATGASTALIAYIGPAAAALLTIYVLLWGTGLAAGQISEPFGDGMKRILRMCVIVGVALTVGVYQDVVVDFFEQAPGELANQIEASAPQGGAARGTDDQGLAATLDDCIAQGLALGNKVWDTAAVVSRLSLFAPTSDGLVLQLLALILYLTVILTVALAAATIFVARLGLALLLAVGPLFILMALFPQTRRWFDAWLGQSVRFVLLFVVIACVSALLFPLLGQYYRSMASSTGEPEALVNALKAVGLSVAVGWVVLQLQSMAMAFGENVAQQVTGTHGGRWSAGVVSGATPSLAGSDVRVYGAGRARSAHASAGTGGRAGVGMARRVAARHNRIEGV